MYKIVEFQLQQNPMYKLFMKQLRASLHDHEFEIKPIFPSTLKQFIGVLDKIMYLSLISIITISIS